MNLNDSLRRQPFVVQNTLMPIVRTHNSGRELEFFNLRPEAANYNQGKGHLFTALCNSERSTARSR